MEQPVLLQEAQLWLMQIASAESSERGSISATVLRGSNIFPDVTEIPSGCKVSKKIGSRFMG